MTSTVRHGTAHYTDLAAARRKYYGNTDDMIAEGRIVIGKPELKPGETLGVYTDQGRYYINRKAP